jgi:hypothetical protein
LLDQRRGLDRDVHELICDCFVMIEAPAGGQQTAGFVHAAHVEDPRQALRAAPPGDQPELHLR